MGIGGLNVHNKKYCCQAMEIVGLNVHNKNYCCWALGGGNSMSTTTLSLWGNGNKGLYIHSSIIAAGNEKGGPNIHNGATATW